MVYHHLNTKYYVKRRVPLNKGHRLQVTRKELLNQHNLLCREQENIATFHFTGNFSSDVFEPENVV